MRNLTATLCLTIAVVLGGMGVSWSADSEDLAKQFALEQKCVVGVNCPSSYILNQMGQILL